MAHPVRPTAWTAGRAVVDFAAATAARFLATTRFLAATLAAATFAFAALMEAGVGVGVVGVGVVGVGVVGAGVVGVGAVGVGVGVGVAAAHVERVIVSVSSVTAPLRASTRPSTVVPVVTVMLVSAMMVPRNVEPVPSVAELPTCQKTLQDCAPLIRLI
jgi:hypothetical protein